MAKHDLRLCGDAWCSEFARMTADGRDVTRSQHFRWRRRQWRMKTWCVILFVRERERERVEKSTSAPFICLYTYPCVKRPRRQSVTVYTNLQEEYDRLIVSVYLSIYSESKDSRKLLHHAEGIEPAGCTSWHYALSQKNAEGINWPLESVSCVASQPSSIPCECKRYNLITLKNTCLRRPWTGLPWRSQTFL